MLRSIITCICFLLLLFSTGSSFGQDADQLAKMRRLNPNLPAPLSIQPDIIAANSILTTDSNHLLMFTDIKGESQIDDFHKIFDAAVPKWCEYFNVPPAKAKVWKMRSMVIGEKERFVASGLFPETLPWFPTGFQLGHEMWMYLQPGNYYTRHLLLHEGTHGFMQWFLGGVGAPWYSEGMAELLALHSWNDGKLKMNFRPTDRKQAEYWGRIKIIKKDCDDNKFLGLDQIFQFQNIAFREINSYAWSWAACEFLANHSLSKESFAKLAAIANQTPEIFNARFQNRIKDVRAELDRDWELFIREVDFGYDVENSRVTLAATTESNADDSGKQTFIVDVSKGWQRTDLQVTPGQRLSIVGSGQFTVAMEGETPWRCESNGITIKYYRGKPLGMLMAGILGSENEVQYLLNSIPIDGSGEIECERSGHLCFRINEYPGNLRDNSGKLTVEVKPVDSK